MIGNSRILLVATLGFVSSVNAQLNTPVKKIHAYKQASIPGIIPVFRDENGNEIRRERPPSSNYWIYAEFRKPEKITISDLWISGKRFKAKNEIISQLPVTKIMNTGATHPDTILLVPATKNNVILTYPSGEFKSWAVSSRYLSGLIRDNELVIGYFWNGKKYFSARPLLTILEPEARQ